MGVLELLCCWGRVVVVSFVDCVFFVVLWGKVNFFWVLLFVGLVVRGLGRVLLGLWG